MPPRPFTQVSPSQINNFKRCPRVWYNASILGNREPQKKNQAKGEAIHKALEVYVQTGEVLPSVEMPDNSQPGSPMVAISTVEFVQVARPHIPPPITDVEHWAPLKKEGSGVMVEQAGELATYEGGPFFIQYIDLVEAYLRTAKITDYKTSSDFRYAKTPEELHQDTQLNSNARWLFGISDYTEIQVGHLYLLTKNVHPKVKPVYTTVTRESNQKVWDRDMATVREMQHWAKLAPETAETLPPNIESCDMYGGCYYRTNCGFSPESKPLFQIRRPNAMANETPAASAPTAGSLLDRMMKAKTGGAGTAPAAAATPAPTAPAAAAAPSAGTASLFAGGVTAPAAPTASTAPAATPAPAAPVQTTVAPPATVNAAPPVGLASLFGGAKPPATAPAAAAPAATTPAVPSGLTPPDAPSSTSTPEEVAAANKEEAAAETPAETTTTTAAPAETVTNSAANAPAETAAETEGKKRHRRTKAEMEAARAAEAAATTAGPVNPAPAGTIPDPASAATGPSTDDILKAAAASAAGGTTEAGSTPLDVLRAQFAGDPSFDCPVQVLFIDCMPSKGWPGDAPTPLTEFMHAFERAAASSSQALDWRLIDFGKGKGWLSVAIRVLMKGLPASIYVDSRTPGADVFESVLTPYVKAIFRGTR